MQQPMTQQQQSIPRLPPPNLADWPILTGETPSTLQAQWHQLCTPQKIIAFYHDRKGEQWRELSNWYTEPYHGFDFVLPQQLLDLAGVKSDKQVRNALFAPVVHCEHSEKALMLCKAAAMGNATLYSAIAAAPTAKECKQLCRCVPKWNEKRWQSVMCGVALSMVYQKFTAVPALREVLLRTGNKILCEATANDHTWAIGISIQNKPTLYQVPARWKGSNVLGWALMQVRTIIREEMDQQQEEEYAPGFVHVI